MHGPLLASACIYVLLPYFILRKIPHFNSLVFSSYTNSSVLSESKSNLVVTNCLDQMEIPAWGLRLTSGVVCDPYDITGDGKSLKSIQMAMR